MAECDWESVAAAAEELLQELPEVVQHLSGVIRDRVPGYAAVSDGQLSAASARNVRDMLHSLRDRRPLTQDELADFTATVEERARNGVPVDEYLTAVTTAEAELWDQLWCRAGSVPESTRLAVFSLRFGNVNAITRVTVAAHRRIELAGARADQERRAGALRALLRGGLQDEASREHLSQLGLALDEEWFVVRARSRAALDADRLAASLRAGLDASLAVFVLWGEQTVGLVRERPQGARSITAGVAGPVTVSGLPAADRLAADVLETAWGLGLEGIFDLDTLGIRVAVQAWPQIGARLRARYIEPVLSAGTLGEELLSTVKVHLQCGGRREVTATTMHVHQNTVGYRLKRFGELTGTDLTDLATLAELHWLFTDLQLRPGSVGIAL